MSLIDALGWLAAAVSCVALLPQAIKLFRDRDSAGVSLMYWQLLLGVVASFVVHGATIGAAQVSVPNVAMSLVAAWTIRLVGRARTIGWVRLFGLPLVLFAGLIGIDVFLGPASYGAATAVPVSIGLVAQIVDVARQSGVGGVSGWFLGLGVLMQASWFSWGMLAVEWAIRISSGAFLVLSVTLMIWWIARRLGLPAIGGGGVPVRTGRAP